MEECFEDVLDVRCVDVRDDASCVQNFAGNCEDQSLEEAEEAAGNAVNAAEGAGEPNKAAGKAKGGLKGSGKSRSPTVRIQPSGWWASNVHFLGVRPRSHQHGTCSWPRYALGTSH